MRKDKRGKVKPEKVVVERSGQLMWAFAVPDMTDPYVRGFAAGVEAGKRELARKLIAKLEV